MGLLLPRPGKLVSSHRNAFVLGMVGVETGVPNRDTLDPILLLPTEATEVGAKVDLGVAKVAEIGPSEGDEDILVSLDEVLSPFEAGVRSKGEGKFEGSIADMLEMIEGSIADMLDARVLIVLSSLGGTAEGSRREVSGVARMEVSGTARVLMVLSNLGGTAEGSNTEILPPEELLLDLFRLAGGLLDSIIERAGWGVSGLGRFWVAGGGNVGSESV